MFYWFAVLVMGGVFLTLLSLYARSKLSKLETHIEKTDDQMKAMEANLKVTRDLLGNLYAKMQVTESTSKSK